jgi:hypothetical protein
MNERIDAERTARLFERGTSLIVAAFVALCAGMVVIGLLR